MAPFSSLYRTPVEEAQVNSVNLSFNTNRPKALWLLGDIHFGHKDFDEELFERHRELALRARAGVLCLGDVLEAVTTGSKVANLGGQFDQTLAIGDQEDAFLDAMKGFVVHATVQGNHEARIERVLGTSPFKNINRLLAAQQKKPCHFLHHGGFVNVRVGKQTYRLMIHHGEGGPSTLFRYLARDFPGADLYAAGHTHSLSHEEFFTHTPKGTKRIICTRTGSYLNMPAYSRPRPHTGGIPATGSWLLWLWPGERRMKLEKMEDRAERVA